jgi:hypothetical protein
MECKRELDNQYMIPVTSAFRWNTQKHNCHSTGKKKKIIRILTPLYTCSGESTQSNVSSKYKSSHRQLRTRECAEWIQAQTEVSGNETRHHRQVPQSRNIEAQQGYKSNNTGNVDEASSLNHCCRGKAISITYWSVRACLCVCARVCGWVRVLLCVCVFFVCAQARSCAFARVALIIRHAKRRHTVICGFFASWA